ncbi:hypothetical protein [Luteococcus peritonei]|uniref:VOC domain-containing protein n=1 Tax=Luteococcus peritonei TaxID=88874 RepID=A0ABW4RYS4_9ACTN
MNQIKASIECYRFTEDPQAMVGFLEALGMARQVSTSDGGFAVLRAAGGSVGVHRASGSQTGAVPGQTQLCLAVASVDEVVGIDGVVTWDEAYGRHAGITDPFGGGIWIDEVQTDLYGAYQQHQAEPRPDLYLTAVRYSPDFAADQAFFARFGLEAKAGDEWWLPLRAADGSTLGLHRPQGEPITEPATDNPVGENSVCDLGFETTEPLEAVRDRLLAAGFEAQIVEQDQLRTLRVIDSDGREVQVHQRG